MILRTTCEAGYYPFSHRQEGGLVVSMAQVHSACRLESCAQPSGPFKPQAELRVPPSSPEDVRRLLCAAGAMYKGAVCRGCLCAEDAVCRGYRVQRVPVCRGCRVQMVPVCRGCRVQRVPVCRRCRVQRMPCAEGACGQRVPVGRGCRVQRVLCTADSRGTPGAGEW